MKKQPPTESSPEVKTTQSGSKTTDSNTVSKVQEPEKKKQPPLPINVLGIINFGGIQELMQEVVKNMYNVLSLYNNIWKINTTEPEDYRALVNKLNSEGRQWYT